jgi:outer membrane lipoprotein-sorting protein
MRRTFCLALVALGASASAETAASAAADVSKLSPQQILEKMEAAANNFADQEMSMRLTVNDVDGSKKSYDMVVWQKGDTKRLAEFTSGEVKGMTTLAEDRDSVYVYLPGMKKVRRVAASNMSQSFAGSDLNSDDMAMVTWSKEWNAQIEKEDATSWWISLTPKGEPKTDYARVVHRVTKKEFAQIESSYFNKAGEKIKTFLMSDPTDFHGVMRYKTMIVTDPRTGHHTDLEIKDFKVNQGLKDDKFTVRQLQWGK